MRAIILTLALALPIAACGDDKKPPQAPAPASAEPTAVEPDPAPADPAPADPAPADPAPAEGPTDDECIADCVQRNQMRAVAADQIERDCAAECSD